MKKRTRRRKKRTPVVVSDGDVREFLRDPRPQLRRQIKAKRYLLELCDKPNAPNERQRLSLQSQIHDLEAELAFHEGLAKIK